MWRCNDSLFFTGTVQVNDCPLFANNRLQLLLFLLYSAVLKHADTHTYSHPLACSHRFPWSNCQTRFVTVLYHIAMNLGVVEEPRIVTSAVEFPQCTYMWICEYSRTLALEAIRYPRNYNTLIFVNLSKPQCSYRKLVTMPSSGNSYRSCIVSGLDIETAVSGRMEQWISRTLLFTLTIEQPPEHRLFQQENLLKIVNSLWETKSWLRKTA